MRVLVVTASWPWLLADGNSLILHHHLHHLAARHEIRVLVGGGPVALQPVGAAEARVPDGVGVQWFGTSVPGPVDHLWRRLRSLRSGEPAHVHWVERPLLTHRVRAEVAAWHPDVVHLQTWGTAQLHAAAGSVPVVHSAVDSWTLGYANRPLPRWRRLIDADQPAKVRGHEARHYPACAAVVVVADRDADAVRAAAPAAHVVVVPNGVEAGPPPAPRAPSPPPVLAYHGNLVTRATEDAAVALVRSVLPVVQRRHPGASVRIVGRSPGPRVLALAGPDVVVTGAVDDIRTAIQDAAVYVAPMVSGSGLKNKVLEAMAAGLPVVTTPAGIDGIGADGVVVAGDLDGVAEQVVALLDDPVRAAALGARARTVAEARTWAASAAALEAVWLEAAGQPCPEPQAEPQPEPQAEWQPDPPTGPEP